MRDASATVLAERDPLRRGTTMRNGRRGSDRPMHRRLDAWLRRLPAPMRRAARHLASALAGFLGTILVAVVAAALFTFLAGTLGGCGSGGGGTDDARSHDARSTCRACVDAAPTRDSNPPTDSTAPSPDTGTENPESDTSDGPDGLADTGSDDAGEDEPDGSYDGTCNQAAPCDLDCATPGESFTCHGVTFERVVNIVESQGADPTGSEPIDGALDSAISDGTLVLFPEGTYRVTERHVLSDDTFGFAGAGDVKFVPPAGYNDQLFISSPNSLADRVVFTKIDIDIREENTTAGLKFYTRSGFHVEDVEYIGRGLHSDAGVVTAFSVGVIESDGVGVLKDCVAKKGSTWARYKAGDGRIGIGVFEPHAGTVRIVDSKMMEFGNNGMYASRHGGDVRVVGGVYRNNNAAAVRIHGDGSYVEGARIEVDPDKYTGPREPSFEDNAFALRGFIAEQKLDRSSSVKSPGVEVRNCDIVFRENPSGATYPIQAKYTGKTLRVVNTRIRDDEDGKPAILRAAQERGARRPSPEPRWLKLEDVDITGSASGGAAVQISDGDGSVIEDVCISQSGDNRDGIRFDGSDAQLRNSTVDVPGDAVVRQNSNVSTSGLSENGDCDAPKL